MAIVKLLNFGSCNIDYVYQLNHVVIAGETESCIGMQIFSGGKGLNQSIAVSRAGSQVYHAGMIGNDGNILLELLKDNGVNIEFLKTVDKKTGHAVIQVTQTGENAIFVHSGANACIDDAYIDFVLEHFSKGDVLLLQNEISNVDSIINKAFEKGMVIILNPSPIKENLQKIDLKKLSCLIVNQTESQAITGVADEAIALEYFKNKYPELKVILTLGKNGSIYQDKNQMYYQASYQVETVDTTAAGDTFTGYFVSGLLKGLSLRENMRFASCASAIAVSKNGAAPSIPSISEVEKNISKLSLQIRNIEDARIKQGIKLFIEKNIATVSITELAEKLGYSPVYTGVIIKKLFGITYKELLIETRLDIASKLLRNSTLSVSEIIASVGYENEGYFRKKFIQKYGKNPLEYRYNYR